ncbi:selenide, water dikinase SelD [Donghicola sp. C2-DW-16]|uniref:Selenide, water dikinase SelD n=1 Tax=Donghicola mangrovi TaxID=2729614 RepID=A0ABX2P9U3_9RHOB|nr:selenide, water dikinase SelD [Donghicola mangrovi]NVO26216.1 selenide, water dikinase SelD [Donghicola mangrovi]
MTSLPDTRDLVFVGGGHAHALVLRMWGMNPLTGVRLTVIDPQAAAPYTGMLPGHIAGHYARADLDIDLVRLARFAGARLIMGRAVAMDLAAQVVTVEGYGAVPYDVASVDVGITSDMPALAGFAEHGVAAKPLGRYSTEWAAFLEAGGGDVAVIGGGLAGVELAMAMAHALGGRGQVSIIERQALLAEQSPRHQRILRSELARWNVTLHEHTEVAEVRSDAVLLSNGTLVSAAMTVGAAGARPHDWLAGTGLALKDGFIRVDEALRTSDPNVFACGDCCHQAPSPRPKAGVYAVRAAPVLLNNLRAALGAGQVKPFRPQKTFLKLVSLGDKRALADKGGFGPKGALMWQWKDHIDQKFMNMFRDLKPMAGPAVPADVADGVLEELGGGKPLCGGCGAKVAAGPLRAALANVTPTSHPDLVTGPGDDAAIVRMGEVTQVITTDHLRAFWEDPKVFARITTIHALGDIFAMGARPQTALVNLTLPRMSPRLQERRLAEVMEGITGALAECGAALAGGHTTLGAELSLGLTLTGILDGPARTKAGARVGDALILTRPLGSGVIMAAEMQLAADGRDVAALLAAQVEPRMAEAEALRGVNALTDVTGFGLGGHLGEMLEASGCGAVIDLDAVPAYAGARELLARGQKSSLHDLNRTAAPIDGLIPPEAEILYDPQTAGGFLAAVPMADVPALMAALRQAGAQPAVIGECVAGPARITLR